MAAPNKNRETKNKKQTVYDIQEPRDTDLLLPVNDCSTIIDLNQSPYHSIDSSLCCGLLRGAVRQDWHTLQALDGDLGGTFYEEINPSWIQLFFDLNVIAALSNIAVHVVNSFADSSSNRYLFLIIGILQYYFIFLLWTEFITFESMFNFDSKLDIILYLFCSFIILSMGYATHDEIEYYSYFLYAFGVSKIAYCLVDIKISLIPRARNWGIYHIIFAIVEIIISFIVSSITISSGIVWIIIYFIFISIEYLKQMLWFYEPIANKISIPGNTHFLRERMEQFTLIIIGGCIVTLITVNDNAPSWDYYCIVYSSYLCICIILIIYFTSQPSKHDMLHNIGMHCLTRASPKYLLIYFVGHQLLYLSLFIFGIGVGIANLNVIYDYDQDKAITICLPCISLSISCISLNLIRISHFTIYHQSKLFWIVRILSILIMIIIPLVFWNILDAIIIVVIVIICVVIQLIVDTKGKVKEEHDDEFKIEAQQRKKILQRYIKHGLSNYYGSLPESDQPLQPLLSNDHLTMS